MKILGCSFSNVVGSVAQTVIVYAIAAAAVAVVAEHELLMVQVVQKMCN